MYTFELLLSSSEPYSEWLFPVPARGWVGVFVSVQRFLTYHFMFVEAYSVSWL